MSHSSLINTLVIASFLGLGSRSYADDAPPQQKPADGQKSAAVAPPSDSKAATQTPAPRAAGAGVAVVDLDNTGEIDLIISNAYQAAAGPTAPQILSNYWIGIDGTPVDDALRAQLELLPAQGLLINQVVDDSPAARAGLKQYDVLILCNDDAISQIADLAKILDEKKETALPLKLVRSGKRIIIEVTPQRRPASQTGETCPSISKATDEEFVRRAWLDVIGASADEEEVQRFIAEKREKKREWLVNRLLRKSTHAGRSCNVCHASDGDAQRIYYQSFLNNGVFRMHTDGRYNINSGWQDVTVFPGFVQNSQGADFTDVGQQLPDDVTVSITRKGREPAKIAVRKGDRIWEISESDGIEKIPEEVRTYLGPFYTSLQTTFVNRNPYVTSTLNLNGQPALQALSRAILWQANGTPVTQFLADPTAQPSATETAFQRLDKQLESLGSQLGELRQAMQQLHQTLDAEKAKPAATEKKP